MKVNPAGNRCKVHLVEQHHGILRSDVAATTRDADPDVRFYEFYVLRLILGSIALGFSIWGRAAKPHCRTRARAVLVREASLLEVWCEGGGKHR